MRAEARDRIEAQFEIHAKRSPTAPGSSPSWSCARAIQGAELLAQIAEDPGIAVLVLAAASGSGGPGPLILRLMRDLSALPCPMTIVPGDISRERLEQIS